MSIVVDRLSHTYHPNTPLETRALRDITFELQRGAWMSVVGHTGSGKSTLVQHLNGLLIPQSGSVVVDGMEVREKSPHLRAVRRKVGLVFQYPEQQLFAESVLEEVAFAPRNWGVPEAEIPGLVQSSLALVGLDGQYLERSPFHLSGGEKRKVAIASVLASAPEYLVLDEPTAGLDSFSRKELVDLLTALKEKGYGILLVTHDLDIALQASDAILILNRGEQVVRDTPRRVIEHLRGDHIPGLSLPDIVTLSAELHDRTGTVPVTWDWRVLAQAIGEMKR
ncbi:MAG TPA: energy-coupling factor ABC transporter ATP-binding protein [Synergistaceae bacterium]|jgi:energy-coupling factor transport system ATP-binding protein|nr:energy-coupling factor ABC transporter ATP-binding protein [Synergistaceae bacterium]